MSKVLQHYLNPLHIYCRMIDVGISKRTAGYFCMLYERILFKKLIAQSNIDKALRP